MTVDLESQIAENYNFEELLFHVSFKTKTYLYGRFDERRNNGGRKKQLQQNMTSRKLPTVSTNNSFLHFKNFCSKLACEALGIREDDFCRNVLNDVRDELLEKYAPLFRYVTQYRVEDWTALLQLVAVMRILEYLNFTPSYDRLSMLSFNCLSKIGGNRYQFKQDLMDKDFNKFDTMYAQSCGVIQYAADIQGKRLVFKKCSGRLPDCNNRLLSAYSSSGMHPGSPVYYVAFGEKNSKKESGGAGGTLLDAFLNFEQYRLEKDAAYTQYIVKNRTRLFDDVFAAVFSEQGSCVENKHAPEVLADMMAEFDEMFPQSAFASEQIRGFLKLVLFDQDQSKIAIVAKRIREINVRAVNHRKRQRTVDEYCDQPSAVQTMRTRRGGRRVRSERKRARMQ